MKDLINLPLSHAEIRTLHAALSMDADRSRELAQELKRFVLVRRYYTRQALDSDTLLDKIERVSLSAIAHFIRPTETD